jgi:hypothetical protein
VLALSDTTTVAVIAAAAAILGALLTGALQFLLERQRHQRDKQERRIDWKRESFAEYLRFLYRIPLRHRQSYRTEEDAARFMTEIEEELAAFRATLLLHASETVQNMTTKDIAEGLPAWGRRHQELWGDDLKRPRDEQVGGDSLGRQAYQETMWPVIARLGKAMRKELGVSE